METADFLARARALVRRHEIRDGARFRLADHDPRDTGPFDGDDPREAKADAREMLEDGLAGKAPRPRGGAAGSPGTRRARGSRR